MVRFWPRPKQPTFDGYLNEQVYDEKGEPTLALVPTRLDDYGEPIEWVYVHPGAENDWDIRRRR